MSLLISFRGPRRRQILLPPKGDQSRIEAGSMSLVAPGELLIPRQARWIVTLELLETSLRLSWSPLGVPDTSRASKSDAQSSCGQISLWFWTLHSSFWALKMRPWAPRAALRAPKPPNNKATWALYLRSLLSKWVTKRTNHLSYLSAELTKQVTN